MSTSLRRRERLNIMKIMTHPHLLLNVGDVEQRLDFQPEFPPRPGPELEVLSQVALDDLESQSGEEKKNSNSH